jgi:dTDP-4-amino-4,6-dideoxygalactose transaminase
VPKVIMQTNPKANYLAHKDEIHAAIAGVLESGSYILGQQVEAFEQEFATYLGVRYGIGVANGTDALHLALRACGVGPGDIVLTVSHTAVATVAAIELCGAVPFFVDINPSTFTMDVQDLERAIHELAGQPLKAVVAVHLYGHPAAMDAIMDLAQHHSLYVVEDCAQSHGAELHGRKTGTWGHVSAFSFYPTKNVGALGDGGIVMTDNKSLANRIRSLREYGWRHRYVSDIPGLNSRLDEVQAAVLRVKLRYLDYENALRRILAQSYDTLLAGAALDLPRSQPRARHVYHQYVIRTTQQQQLQGYLHEQGVRTLIHYPVPVHQQPAYTGRIRSRNLAHTELAARQILSLPMYPELSLDETQVVVQHILEWSHANI